jgi:glycosyltransferase involved in cell wall biosynthesis
MRIAQIAPLFESVPPKLYGGTERIVAALTNELVSLGHEVTVFAAEGSHTKGHLHAVCRQPLRLDPEPLKSEAATHLAMLCEVRRGAASFDVLHFHTELLHLPLFADLAGKCVSTLHGRLDLKGLDQAYRCWAEHGLVSVSDQQRTPMPHANWLATVHHGLPPGEYRLTEAAEGYLAFLGRMSPEKAPEQAIRIALRAGLPLKMAAKVDAVDKAYFESVVRPLLAHPLIEFVGEISEAEKADFLGNARALLFPIRWPEPFGLVMIEAMACGTPVIATAEGSVPEVIEHGRNGFIVRTEEEALHAIRTLDRLSRPLIRATFDRRFTARRMARDYIGVYRSLLESRASRLVQAV